MGDKGHESQIGVMGPKVSGPACHLCKEAPASFLLPHLRRSAARAGSLPTLSTAAAMIAEDLQSQKSLLAALWPTLGG